MAAQLVERYGDSLHTEDISWIAWEPQRTDTLTVAGKEYQASYFGEEDISGWAGDYQSRAFWRLEGAYEDFEDCPESSDVLPCNDYPMPIEVAGVCPGLHPEGRNIRAEVLPLRRGGMERHGLHHGIYPGISS